MSAPAEWTDDELIARVAAELRERETPITLVLRPLTAVSIVGLLQLALRHPDIETRPAFDAITVIEHVRGAFGDTDAEAVLELIRRGDGDGRRRH